MSNQMLVTLSDKQQELLAGGADFSLNGSNFANKGSTLRGGSKSGLQGSTAQSTGQSKLTITAAQDFLGLGGDSVPEFEALGAAQLPNGPEPEPSPDEE